HIVGTDIEVASSTEDYIRYRSEMRPLLQAVGSQFEKWYDCQDDCYAAAENFSEIFYALVYPVMDRGVQILTQQDVYSVSAEMLYRSFAERDVLSNICDLFDALTEEIEEIEYGAQAAAQRRQQRKASRTRAVGVGYGLKGTVKAAVTAGTINAATGAMHSFGNAVGNTGTAISSFGEKMKVYKKYKPKLSQEMYDIAGKAVAFVQTAISDQTGQSFRFLINGKVRNVGASDAILANYLAGRIQESRKKEQILESLQLNPLNIEIYKVVWDAYGDNNGELRLLARFFELPLDDYVQKSANEYCQRLFQKVCGDYLKAKNPLKESVAHEADFCAVLEEIREYCREQMIEPDEVDVIGTIEKYLSDVDRELRKVNGVLYDSREEAVSVRSDIEVFSAFLTSHSMNEPDIYEKLSNVSFSSACYRTHLREIFEREVSYRDPVQLTGYLRECASRYFPDENTRKMIEPAQSPENRERKNRIFENILSLQEMEAPILLVSYKASGKAGLLITNQNLHSYSKGLLSSSDQCIPIEKINHVEYMGDDVLRVYSEGEKIDLTIRKVLTFDEKNSLGGMLQEVLHRVMNLRQTDRENLKYIDENSVRCRCGAYIPNTTRICPSCFCMYMDKNLFEETVPCHFCGRRNRVNAKFCSHCGKKAGIEQEQAAKCPGCGNLVHQGQKFCKYCGTKLVDVPDDDRI
ncbi:MAG: zinc ribbon domain-containing protein, partial [Clostridiales bacterium]|nr:zinc ribbon domain-containing protein [Clostridiales bacterium]